MDGNNVRQQATHTSEGGALMLDLYRKVLPNDINRLLRQTPAGDGQVALRKELTQFVSGDALPFTSAIYIASLELARSQANGTEVVLARMSSNKMTCCSEALPQKELENCTELQPLRALELSPTVNICSAMIEAVRDNSVEDLRALQCIFPGVLSVMGEAALLYSLRDLTNLNRRDPKQVAAATWLLQRGVDLPDTCLEAYGGALSDLQPKEQLSEGNLGSLDYLSSLIRNRQIIFAEACSRGDSTDDLLHKALKGLVKDVEEAKSTDTAREKVGIAMANILTILTRKTYYSPAVQILHSEASAVGSPLAEEIQRRGLEVMRSRRECLDGDQLQAAPNSSVAGQGEILAGAKQLEKGLTAFRTVQPAQRAQPSSGQNGHTVEHTNSGHTHIRSRIFLVTDRMLLYRDDRLVGFAHRHHDSRLHFASLNFPGKGKEAIGALDNWLKTRDLPTGIELRLYEDANSRPYHTAPENTTIPLQWMEKVIQLCGDHSDQAEPRADRSPLVVVPGYNMSVHAAVRMGLELQADLERKGPVIVFSWCSNSMWGALGYLNVRMGINRNVPQLLSVLSALQEEIVHWPVQVIAHSMGCQITSKALFECEDRLLPFGQLEVKRDCNNRNQPDRQNLTAILRRLGREGDTRFVPSFVFLHADVEVDVFQSRANVFCKRGLVTLYCAEDDIALWHSQYLRLLGYFSPRAGLLAEKSALPTRYDTVDVTGMSKDRFKHSCWRNRSVTYDIQKALAGFHPEDESRVSGLAKARLGLLRQLNKISPLRKAWAYVNPIAWDPKAQRRVDGVRLYGFTSPLHRLAYMQSHSLCVPRSRPCRDDIHRFLVLTIESMSASRLDCLMRWHIGAGVQTDFYRAAFSCLPNDARIGPGATTELNIPGGASFLVGLASDSRAWLIQLLWGGGQALEDDMASVRDRTRAKVPQTQCALVDFRKARTPDPQKKKPEGCYHITFKAGHQSAVLVTPEDSVSDLFLKAR